MFNKSAKFIIFHLLVHKICLSECKALPTASNGDHLERKSPTTSYYRDNIFGPNSYAFGFQVNDNDSGNMQFRDERRYANGTTQGSYGYATPDGGVVITRYLVDDEFGYVSQSKNFEYGDEAKWEHNWPIRKPNKSMSWELESKSKSQDDKGKVNLTSVLLPIEPIKEEQGIDLNPPHLEKEIINPAILEALNGKVPLISDPKKIESSNGFETINKFIPAKFPIVPFQLPAGDLKRNLNEGADNKSTPLPPASVSSPDVKYAMTEETTAPNSPSPQSISIDKHTDWQHKVINQARQEYLATVH